MERRGCCTRKKSKCSSLFTGKCLQKRKTLAIDPLISKKQITQTGPSE